MKLGTHELPNHRLFPSLTEYTKAVYDNFGTEPRSRDLIAPLLGHRGIGGAFYAKLRGMMAYGLLQGRRTYSVTELGRRITYPTNKKEEAEAIKDAVLRIPLWAQLFKKYGQDLPTEKLWVSLMDFTGVTGREAKDAEKEVRAAYQDDIRRVPWDLLREEEGLAGESAQEAEDLEGVSPDMVSFNFQNIQIRLPREDTLKAWDKAKRMMDIALEVEESAEPTAERTKKPAESEDPSLTSLVKKEEEA